MFAAASLTEAFTAIGEDFEAALSKLTLGEVDAALVYRTDVEAAGSRVDGVEFPESASAVNEYPIAVLGNAPNRAAATAFVAHVTSDEARAVLTEATFQVP